MKKITLNEADLLKIVKRVLNEQEDRRFDEDEIDLLHFIFERELKPPFRKGEIDSDGYYKYFNRDGEHIGRLVGTLDLYTGFAVLAPFLNNIDDKVRQVFGLPPKNSNWWFAVIPHLKSWLGSQLNVKIRYIESLYMEL